MCEIGNLFVDGEAYERRMGRWTRLAGEAFLNWLDVPTGLQWLDVGCGSGAFTEVLTARCLPAKVVAIDLPFRAARGVGAIARRRGVSAHSPVDGDYDHRLRGSASNPNSHRYRANVGLRRFRIACIGMRRCTL